MVMATPMTIREEKFHKLMERYESQATILPLPCPGLMDYVERGDLTSVEFQKYLEELLYEYSKNKVDAAVLGCTHYPFARDMIQKILGQEVAIYDGGEGTAREMRRRLEEAGLLNQQSCQGKVAFLNSLQDEKKIDLCVKLFNL